MALGLTTDDVTAIEEFTETLKKKRSPYDVSQLKKDAETDELKSRVSGAVKSLPDSQLICRDTGDTLFICPK